MNKKFVVVTPARNEEAYIEKTIQSMIAQTMTPEKWVIVSDGSTDRTDAIVEQYLKTYPFIELIRADSTNNRNFGSKVKAFFGGFNRVKHLDYAFIGNLDADVSFKPDYFAELFKKFDDDEKLGIAGGWICEADKNGEFKERPGNRSRTVPGAVQMFRRACFEDTGGYIPIPVGGEDPIAEVSARMHGWKVKAFNDLPVNHYRPTGTQGKNIFEARLYEGRRDFVMGYHPLFELLKCALRVFHKPYILSGMLRFFGFFICFFNGEKCAVPKDIARFQRKEQLGMIFSFLRR